MFYSPSSILSDFCIGRKAIYYEDLLTLLLCRKRTIANKDGEVIPTETLCLGCGIFLV